MLRQVVRTIVLLALAAIVWFAYVQRTAQRHPAPSAPAVVPGTEKPKAVGSPEPGFLVQHARDLGLSKDQVAKLQKDADAFERKTAPLRQQLDEAGRKVAAELNRLSSEKVSLPDVQQRARLVSDLSKKLADVRKASWEAEQQMLTPEQRRKALDAWAKAHQFFTGGPAAGKAGKVGQSTQGDGG